MSVAEEYHKLKAQLEEMGGKAKEEALAVIESALATLRSLGHNYHLVEGGGNEVGNGRAASAPRSSGGRRTGIREQVLDIVKQHGPATRGEILTRMDAQGDKSASQSVSNALAALKKNGSITQEGGQYKAA